MENIEVSMDDLQVLMGLLEEPVEAPSDDLSFVAMIEEAIKQKPLSIEEQAMEAAWAVVNAMETVSSSSDSNPTSQATTPVLPPKRKYNKRKSNVSSSSGIKSKKPKTAKTGSAWHHEVYITDPAITDGFFQNPDAYTEQDVSSFRTVQFDLSQAGHAPARQACHTMKMLYLISEAHGIPIKDLMHLCGSMESYNCQALVNSKEGQRQCDGPCMAGYFFCCKHKDEHGHQHGAQALMLRRASKA